MNQMEKPNGTRAELPPHCGRYGRLPHASITTITAVFTTMPSQPQWILSPQAMSPNKPFLPSAALVKYPVRAAKRSD